MRRTHVLSMVFVVLCALTASADKVVVKDRGAFKGKILSVTTDEVKILTNEGAELTFARQEVEQIERDTPAAPKTTPAAQAIPNTAGLATIQAEMTRLRQDVEELKKQNQDLSKQIAEIKGLQEKLDKLTGTVSEVGTRASRLPPKRGDFPGSQNKSKFKFGRCTVERGGDEWIVHGFIRNAGSSPGEWVRIISELKDTNGNVFSHNEIKPTFTPSGAFDTHDKSVLSPGEEYEFYSYIPFGRWASSNDNIIGIVDNVKPPKGMTQPEITDTLTLTLPRSAGGAYIELKVEVPPKEYPDSKTGKATPGKR